MSHRISIAKSDLEQLYIHDRLGSGEIAKMYNCSKVTILNWVRRYNLKVWTNSEWRTGRPNPLIAEIVKRPGVRWKMSKNHADFRGSKNPNYGNHKLAGANNPNWRGGMSKHGYPWYFNKALKRQIFERDGFRCWGCGLYPCNSLEVHHINYVKNDCSLTNLISVCRKCNARANFKREYWEGYYCQIMKDRRIKTNTGV